MESASVKAARLDFSKLDQPVYMAGWRVALIAFGVCFVWILLSRTVFGIDFGGEWSLAGVALQAAFMSFVMWGVARLIGSAFGLRGLPRIRQSATVSLPSQDVGTALERLRTAIQARRSLEECSGVGDEVAFEYRGTPVPIHAFDCEEGVRVESQPGTRRYGGDWYTSVDQGRILREVQWAVSILEESVDSDRPAETA